MKLELLVAMAALSLSGVVASAQTLPSTSPTSEPVAVATVDGRPISADEFNRELAQINAQYSAQMPPEELQKHEQDLRDHALADLVNKSLLLQAAKDEKVSVTGDEVNKIIDDMYKAAPGQNLDDDLKRVGMTRAAFNEQVQQDFTIKKLLDAKAANITVSDDDVTKYYNANQSRFMQDATASARHILIAFAPDDDAAKKAAKKAKAESIRQRLLAGEDFVAVCAATSDDPGSKNNGGLYEDITPGKMVKPFEDAVFSQPIGQVGPLVETQFGYHIIKVESRTPGKLTPLADIKDQLKPWLENQKKQEFLQLYVEHLKGAVQITYAAGYVPPPLATMPTTAPDAASPSTQPAQ